MYNMEKKMKLHIDELALCGLNCKTCVRSSSGPIKESAETLLKHLEGFSSFAEKFSVVNPVYAGYKEFENFLTHLTKAECNGCRNGSECFSGCSAKKCHIENNVNYCFQCAEFPCSRNSFPPALEEKWKNNNNFMKENGVQAFYDKQAKEPRY